MRCLPPVVAPFSMISCEFAMIRKLLTPECQRAVARSIVFTARKP
jgi:hypothetical protein